MNRSQHPTRSLVCCSIVSILSLIAAPADAEIVLLRGIADGSSSYTEEFSGAFFQLDLTDPPPRETQQRFRAIGDPTISFGSSGFDGFPNDELFQLGYFGFDAASLVNDSGTATIDEIVFSLARDPIEPSHVNYGRWTNVETNDIVIDPRSTVTFSDGVITGIDLQSTMSLAINQGLFQRTLTGFFNVSGSRFEGNFSSDDPPNRVIYDFSGTLTSTMAVPEPGVTTALCVICGLRVLSRRRPRVA